VTVVKRQRDTRASAACARRTWSPIYWRRKSGPRGPNDWRNTRNTWSAGLATTTAGSWNIPIGWFGPFATNRKRRKTPRLLGAQRMQSWIRSSKRRSPRGAPFSTERIIGPRRTGLRFCLRSKT